jgi:hypothetical protein
MMVCFIASIAEITGMNFFDKGAEIPFFSTISRNWRRCIVLFVLPSL